MQNATDPSILTAAELMAADRQHRVMYVDGEMAAVDLRDRLAAPGPLPASPEFTMADLCQDSLPDPATEDGQAALAKAAFGPPPDLLVLDNLSSLPGHLTGEPDPWPKVQPFLLGLRRHMAVLVVHHTNKSGALRGSAQHDDVLDLVLALRRPPDYKPQQGVCFELHIEKARTLAGYEIGPAEVKLRLDAAGRADRAWWPIELKDSHRIAAQRALAFVPFSFYGAD